MTPFFRGLKGWNPIIAFQDMSIDGKAAIILSLAILIWIVTKLVFDKNFKNPTASLILGYFTILISLLYTVGNTLNIIQALKTTNITNPEIWAWSAMESALVGFMTLITAGVVLYIQFTRFKREADTTQSEG